MEGNDQFQICYTVALKPDSLQTESDCWIKKTNMFAQLVSYFANPEHKLQKKENILQSRKCKYREERKKRVKIENQLIQ